MGDCEMLKLNGEKIGQNNSSKIKLNAQKTK